MTRKAGLLSTASHNTAGETSASDKPSASDKRAFTIPEVAKLSSLCRATIYREMDSGALASIKIRKRRLVTAAALDAWLANAAAA